MLEIRELEICIRRSDTPVERVLPPGAFVLWPPSAGKNNDRKGRCIVDSVQKTGSPLETEPLSKLLLRYSVPTTLTLMVNYLYNVVDQIFIGHGVEITGMAAVNVAFPVSILVNAVALLLGDGCAANVSLCLGRKDQETADRIFSHAVTWIITGGIVMALLCGSTDTAYVEAAAYLRVIALGIPFQLVCPAFTAMIGLTAHRSIR